MNTRWTIDDSATDGTPDRSAEWLAEGRRTAQGGWALIAAGMLMGGLLVWAGFQVWDAWK